MMNNSSGYRVLCGLVSAFMLSAAFSETRGQIRSTADDPVTTPKTAAVNTLPKSKPGQVARVTKDKSRTSKSAVHIFKTDAPITPYFDVHAPEFLGTKIFPNSTAPGDMVELQAKVAKDLSRLDIPYPARVGHFGWLAQNERFLAMEGRIVGWSGVILEAKALPDNGWIAKVRVRPRVTPQGRYVILDYVDETYRYQNGKAVLMDSDANLAKPKKQDIVAF